MALKILITGNLGYVGPSVVAELRNQYPDSKIIGFDNAYFAHCLMNANVSPERLLDQQNYGDIRNLDAGQLQSIDVIVHLAAVSNDPMGDKFAAVTKAINQDASLALAKAASQAGVGHFVFASSCSVYGVAEGGPRREGDPLNPVTQYAASKIGTEQALQSLGGDMIVTCLRFATACGMAPRLRLDLVLNDFVACALSTGKITVLSDGSPWRPLIDTCDMARAICWAARRQRENGGPFVVVNTGSSTANFQVRDLATAVAKAVPGTSVSINTEAPADSRSYQVDFSLFKQLAPDHQPIRTLEQSISELVVGLQQMGFSDPDFRNSNLIRLRVLEQHVEAGLLTKMLVWNDPKISVAA